ncbi:adenine phosphoribosyltransferase [Chrysoperla carnea]|uniref:adenine phosphoribosyltransferase n=1 Tax=Chrysoperla carnea TaxID=189513 RepID=UPI001D07FB04|nr:adenine phosphoribosyltransferase [Chrysoperla carnea]
MAECSKKEKIEYLKGNITSYPNFPKPGILFRDIFALLKNPTAFRILKELVVEYAKSISPKIEIVVGLESRGFLFGPLIALDLEIPFVPIRKKGKLPGKLESIEYTLEYGKEIFEIQADQITTDQRVLIVDDLLATGGSLAAACQLIEKSGAKVSCCLAIMELVDLKGRDKINAPIHTLVKY